MPATKKTAKATTTEPVVITTDTEQAESGTGPKAKVSAKLALATVLAASKAKDGMKTRDIVEAALEIQEPKPLGKTPKASLEARLATNAQGDDAIFTRTAPGTFKITPKGRAFVKAAQS